MIETGRQATQALKEIKRKTRWSLRTIAGKLDINHTTVWQIFKGHVDNPTQEFMDKIEVMRDEL